MMEFNSTFAQVSKEHKSTTMYVPSCVDYSRIGVGAGV